MYLKKLIIPRNELERRIKLFQKELLKNKIDYALILQNADLFYFTGFVFSGIVLISQDKILIFSRKDTEYINQYANIGKIIEISSIKDIKNYIKNNKIIGFETDIVPYQLIEYYKKLLSPQKISDITPLIREIKAIKSSIEIEFIKNAANLLYILCNEIKKFIKPGIEEYKVFAKAQEILINNGHQGYARMRGFNQEMFYGHILSGRESLISGYLNAPTCGKGLYPAFPQGSSRRIIKEGDLLSVDLVAVYNGYHADQTRPFVVGKITEIYKENFKKAVEIQKRVVDMIKPGVLWEDAYYKAIEISKKLKVNDFFMGLKAKVKFVGHGIGVEVDEYPFLAPKMRKEFKENMVFAIEPKIFIPKLSVIGIENTFVVKKDKCISLTTYPDKITKI